MDGLQGYLTFLCRVLRVSSGAGTEERPSTAGCLDDEGSQGEEGETEPESQCASNTRDQVHRLHHIVLLN